VTRTREHPTANFDFSPKHPRGHPALEEGGSRESQARREQLGRPAPHRNAALPPMRKRKPALSACRMLLEEVGGDAALAGEACAAGSQHRNPDQRGFPMNILRAWPVSTGITALGATFARFVARPRHTMMHGKPSDVSVVQMTVTRAIELAAEAARRTWVQQLP